MTLPITECFSVTTQNNIVPLKVVAIKKDFGDGDYMLTTEIVGEATREQEMHHATSCVHIYLEKGKPHGLVFLTEQEAKEYAIKHIKYDIQFAQDKVIKLTKQLEELN